MADRVTAGPESEFEERLPTVQPLAPAAASAEAAPASVDRVLSTPGEALEPAARAEMERRFREDFSMVRVHRGAEAEASARDLNARAYTVGHDIVFARGELSPASPSGKRLLAHELAHVLQQRAGGGHGGVIQRDLAVPPTTAAPVVATLTPAQIAAAITFNKGRFTDAAEISLLRDILGLKPTPAEIDEPFVLAVVQYQAAYGLTQDGRVDARTVEQLSKEVIAEGTFLGAGNLGDLAPEFRLRDSLRTMINAKNTSYAAYKTAIQGGSLIQKNVALLHQDLLTSLRDTLAWNDFAKCVELLGRTAPNHDELVASTTVVAAISAAWNASNPSVPGPGTTQHEEGGWMYLNLITGEITTRRATAGGGASISLANPPIVADSIVVGEFHTHPNLGPGWVAGTHAGDIASDTADGLPDVIAGTTGIDPTVFTLFRSGPDRRLHLAGNQGLPGSSGGLAPQEKRMPPSSWTLKWR